MSTQWPAPSGVAAAGAVTLINRLSCHAAETTRMSLTHRPRVLLVDDHPAMLVAVVRLLKADCDIVGALTSGQAVLERARQLRPDVVVLDVNLGDASGLDVCPALVSAIPGVRVVILTALADPEIEQEAFRRGAAAFVSKWQMAEQLLTTILRLGDDRTADTRPLPSCGPAGSAG